MKMLRNALWAALCVACILVNTANAATNTWTQLVSGNASGNWNTAANPPWSLAAIPVAGDTAIFTNLDLTATSFVTLGADQSADALFFADTVGTSTWIVTNSFGSLNTLTLSGPNPVVVVGNGTAGLDVPVLGTAGFTKLGGGTLGLTNLNTFTGNVTIRAGTLGIYQGDGTGTTGTLGTAPGVVTADNITINGGILYNISSRGFITSCRLHPNRGITIGSSSGTFTVNNAGFFLAVQGPVSGSGNITKNGGGTLCLDGATTSFSGKYTATAGYITFGSSHNPASFAADALTLNGGGVHNNNGIGTLISYTMPANMGITLGASGGTFVIDTTSGNVGVTLTAPITGSGLLRKIGQGFLRMNVANTYTGGTVISNGFPVITHPRAAIEIGDAKCFGTGLIRFLNTNYNNGFRYVSTSSTNTIANNIALSPYGPQTNRWMVDPGLTVIFSGTISSNHPAGTLLKDSEGTMVMSANNTYTGTTLNLGGKLLGVTGGSVSNSDFMLAPSVLGATNGVIITDNTKRWTIGTLSNLPSAAIPGLEFRFNTAASTTVAPLNVLSNADFTQTPTVLVTVTNLSATTGNGYPLMTWASASGTPPSTTELTLQPSSIFFGGLSVVGNTLYLQLTNKPSIRWAAGSSNWDTSSGALNWRNDALSLVAFNDGDNVQFEDTQNSGGGTVTVNGGVSPIGVLVNSVNAYAFGGDGSINGFGALIKNGTGSLTISNTFGNSYTGGTVVNGGTVVVTPTGSTFGAFGDGSVTVNNNATVVVNGDNSVAGIATANTKSLTLNSGGLVTNAGPFTVQMNQLVMNGGTLAASIPHNDLANWRLDQGLITSGAGNTSLIQGGSIGLSQAGATVFNTLANDTVVVNSEIAITIGADSGLTKIGAGMLILGVSNSSVGPVILDGGTLRLGTHSSLPSGLFTFRQSTLASTDGTTRYITNNVQSDIASTVFTIGDGVGTGDIVFVNPFAVFTGTTGRGLVANANVEFANNFTGNNGPFTKTGAKNMIISGNATVIWSTGWAINAGGLIVNGNLVSATPVSIAFGATLGGNGLVAAPISVAPGGRIAPGTSIGTLTVTNSPSWTGGNVVFELNSAAPQTSDLLTNAVGNFTFTGANLIVTNIGPALVMSNTFTLFSPGNTGSFATTSLPPLGPGLGWDLNNLASAGTITVIPGVASNPTNITYSVAGNQLTLSWPGDHLGWTLQSQTNSLNVGITTNWFDLPGTASGTNYITPFNPLNPTVFYRLRY